jgi:hypothetical protein
VAIGVERLTIFGFDFTYPNAHHAEKGRACVEFYLGIAKARGIQIGLPDNTTLMDGCTSRGERYYGYDGMAIAAAYDDDGDVTLTFTPAPCPPPRRDRGRATTTANTPTPGPGRRFRGFDRSHAGEGPEGVPLRPRPPPRRLRCRSPIVEIDEDVAGGLEDEGYIAEPTADEIEAAQSGCVVIEAPVEIPADWAKLNAAEAVKLARALGAGAGVKSKAAAHQVIEAELARRAAAEA